MKDEPAFPNDQRTEYSVRCKCGAEVTFNDVTHHGMTLRDYFAAKASEDEIEHQATMIGAVEKVVNDGAGGNKRIVWGQPDNWRQIARYMHADAMLEARKK